MLSSLDPNCLLNHSNDPNRRHFASLDVKLADSCIAIEHHRRNFLGQHDYSFRVGSENPAHPRTPKRFPHSFPSTSDLNYYLQKGLNFAEGATVRKRTGSVKVFFLRSLFETFFTYFLSRDKNNLRKHTPEIIAK